VKDVIANSSANNYHGILETFISVECVSSVSKYSVSCKSYCSSSYSKSHLQQGQFYMMY